MLITSSIEKPGRVITLHLDCRAPRRKVFETWTQPEWLKRWFRADEGFVCTTAEVDLRPGGKFRLAMAMPGQPETVFNGEFQQVRENEGLVYTWAGGEAEHQTLVTAMFADRDQGSRIDFTHGVFLTQQARDEHAQGWMACFKMLAKTLGEE